MIPSTGSIRMISLILLSTLLSLQTCIATSTNHIRRAAQNAIPKYPYEENTTRFCAWWLDNDGSWTCPTIEQTYGVSMADFHKWVTALDNGLPEHHQANQSSTTEPLSHNPMHNPPIQPILLHRRLRSPDLPTKLKRPLSLGNSHHPRYGPGNDGSDFRIRGNNHSHPHDKYLSDPGSRW